jgi:hypothetical protein
MDKNIDEEDSPAEYVECVHTENVETTDGRKLPYQKTRTSADSLSVYSDIQTSGDKEGDMTNQYKLAQCQDKRE